MVMLVLALLVILAILGYVQIPFLPFLDIILFTLNGREISVLDILVLLVILWAIGILPTPFRQIIGAIFVIWLLAVLGFIAVAGLSNILVIAVIVGIIIYLLGGF